MATIRDGLLALPDEASRARVLRWAWEAAGLSPSAQPATQLALAARSTGGPFSSLPELLDATQPDRRAEKILVVAHWLETATGSSELTSQAINDELKNLGEGVPNITVALAGLIAKKPALIRQTGKSGRAQQARKRYALTTAGRAAVQSMLARSHREE